MNKYLGKFKLTTLGAGLALTLATGAISSVSHADINDEIRAAQASKISLRQAIDYADKQAAGELMGIEFDDDDRGGGSYEVKYSNGTTGYEVKVDAMTGKIIQTESERLEREDVMAYNKQQQAKISPQSVINAVEKQAKARVLGIEFEHEDDESQHSPYYEVKMLKNNQIIELKINANTGREFAREIER